jgi:hypothetical protein
MRRLLRRPPLVAFLALAAGLAGTLVLFALADAADFRPIPGVARPERLVSIEPPALSYASSLDFERALASAGSGLDGFAAFAHRRFAFAAGDGPEERRTGVVVAGNYFGVLGVRAAAGRLLGREDDRPEAPLAVVLSHALWRNRFAGASDVVGREARLNGTPFRVVGVAAHPFRNLVRERSPDLWVTAHAWIENAPSTCAGRSLEGRGWSWLRAFGRLAPEATLAVARARIELEAARLKSLHSAEIQRDFDRVAVVRSALAAAGLPSEGAARLVSLGLVGLAFLVVLLAASSAAHLFLARGEARLPELATRLALGAGALAGLVPARRLLADDPLRALGAARTVARGSARIRRALSVTRVAISLFLVAATALASRALLRATAIETGYRGERLGFATLDAGVGRPTPERAAAAYQTALAALAALPEVQGASLLAALPLDPGTDVESFAVAGYTPAPDQRMATEVNYLGPRALSLPGGDLLSGREIDARDTAAAEPVAVVSRRFAERYFGGRDPLGDAVRLSTVSVRVVGVAEDVHAHGPGEVQPPALYLPLFQARGSVLLRPVSIVDRARRDPGALLATVTRAPAATAPGVPVEPVGRYDDLLAAALALGASAALLLLVGLGASFGPALRATGVAPAETLRAE